MPPFRNTVGFINGHKGEPDPLQKFDVFFLGKGFRGDVKQLGNAIGDIFLHLAYFIFGQGTVEHMGGTVVVGDPPDGIHLVLHQGDQGGYNDGGALLDQGGQLVTQGFPATCRHYDKGVLMRQYILYNIFLQALEGGETKIFLERSL